MISSLNLQKPCEIINMYCLKTKKEWLEGVLNQKENNLKQGNGGRKKIYITKYKKILIVKNNISDVFCILNYLKLKFRSVMQ